MQKYMTVRYPAALDGVVFLLQTLLDTDFLFVRDEDEAPPFLRFGVDGKLNGFNLEGEVKDFVQETVYKN